jgi:hypothetical protein
MAVVTLGSNRYKANVLAQQLKYSCSDWQPGNHPSLFGNPFGLSNADLSL